MIRTGAGLCIAIVAPDALESVIAIAVGIPYARLMPVQIVVYVAIGFAFRRRAVPFGRTVAAIAATALVEATLGEWVAVAMHAAPATPIGTVCGRRAHRRHRRVRVQRDGLGARFARENRPIVSSA